MSLLNWSLLGVQD